MFHLHFPHYHCRTPCSCSTTACPWLWQAFIVLCERVHMIGWKVRPTPTWGTFLWLAEKRAISDWLQILPCLKKMHLWIETRQGSLKKIHTQMQRNSQMASGSQMQIRQFVNKCHNIHIWFWWKLQMFLNKDICGFPWYIFKTSYICVCIKNTFVNFINLYVDYFYIYIEWEIFVCALKNICVLRDIYI